MSRRVAHAAGKNPLINPMSREKPSERVAIADDRAEEYARSENDPKFSIEIEKNYNIDEKASPTTPPAKESASDSVKSTSRMLRRQNTSTRNVPT